MPSTAKQRHLDARYYRYVGRRGLLPSLLFGRRTKLPGPEADLEMLQGDMEAIAADFRKAVDDVGEEIAAGERQS